MNPVSINKEKFKEYLAGIGMPLGSIRTYSSSLNKITTAVRDFCNTDIGSVYAVVDVRLLTHWLKTLKDKEGFNVINEKGHKAASNALQKYIEFAKHLAELPKK